MGLQLRWLGICLLCGLVASLADCVALLVLLVSFAFVDMLVVGALGFGLHEKLVVYPGFGVIVCWWVCCCRVV